MQACGDFFCIDCHMTVLSRPFPSRQSAQTAYLRFDLRPAIASMAKHHLFLHARTQASASSGKLEDVS